MSQEIHLISFDVPFPPNYGGVVDVYYKIKAFKEIGIDVHLHCFEYGRGKQEHLESICKSVHYYRRDENKLNFLKKQPFIVASRANAMLLEQLKKDNFPIIIEGLHNCWLIEAFKPSDRLIYVRTHNVEHDYYNGLAKVERNLAKKQYYKWEASKLEKYEDVLAKADGLFSISKNDYNYFQNKYQNAHLVPAFHSGIETTSKTGKGNYALYHGNMAVGENIEAATYLIEKVFAELPYDLIIAGSNPPQELILLAEKYANISIHSNISVSQLEDLIKNAHINVLPTFQPTGIKLKLLSALYKGRYCLANTEMIDNTGLESICHIANQPIEWILKIKDLFGKEFTETHIQRRKDVLYANFCNTQNAKIISELLEKVLVEQNG